MKRTGLNSGESSYERRFSDKRDSIITNTGSHAMPKTVILMRHARAEEAHRTQRDFDRDLTPDGREMALMVAESLKSVSVTVDHVISSAAVRTLNTACIVSAAIQPKPTVQPLAELYNAPAGSFAAAVRQYGSDDQNSIMVVGHNPGIAGLMCQWAQQVLSVPPATLTVFEWETTDWADIHLQSPVTPRLVCVIQEGHITHREVSGKSDRR